MESILEQASKVGSLLMRVFDMLWDIAELLTSSISLGRGWRRHRDCESEYELVGKEIH